MTIDAQQSDVTTAGETPVAAATEAPETPSEGSEGGGETGGEGGAQAQQTPPPYTVNPSYKVKNLEKKFPEWILPVVKDAKTEAELREIFQKADGVEFVKQDRQTLKDRVQTYEQKIQQHYGPLEQSVQRLVHFRDQKDFGAMFQVAGVNPKEVLEWALNYAQSSPEQRTLAQRASQESLSRMDVQTQMEQMQQAYQQQAADYRARELDMMISRPDVSGAIQDFEAMHGQGSFRQEVIRRGQFYAYQGQDIPAEQAVMEVLRLTGRAPTAQATQQVAAPQSMGQMPQAQGAAAPVAQQAKPVIPNIQGRGTSPAKRVIGSMADIRKRRQELEAESD